MNSTNDTKLSFARYEKKYLLSGDMYDRLWRELSPRVEPDEYHRSTVCSLYFDDSSYSLIRASIDAPIYKEKLRIRSYGVPAPDGEVFVELKKKFKGIVYKRRVQLREFEAMRWLEGESGVPCDGQIAREIDWVVSRHELKPTACIICDRYAYVAKDDPELRITIDSSIRHRDTELSLSAGDEGDEILEPGQVLMELKLPGSAPIWLSNLLSRCGAFPVSFSKYGSYYKNSVIPKYYDGVIIIA